MSAISYRMSDYTPHYNFIAGPRQELPFGDRIQADGDSVLVDGRIRVSHFPNLKIAEAAIPHWEWQRIASTISALVTGVIAGLGFLCLSALREPFVAKNLVATGPVCTILVIGSLLLGTGGASLAAFNAIDECDRADRELVFWRAETVRLKEHGVLPVRIAAARSTIFYKDGRSLTVSERDLALGRIITQEEAESLQGPFRGALGETDFDRLLVRLCHQGEEGAS